jgi:transposase
MKKTGFDFHITPELLGLDNIKINNVSMVSDGSIHIQVGSTKKELLCQHCQQPTAPNGSGRPLTLRHLPLLGREVYIHITPQRGICKDCDDSPTSTQVLNWFHNNGHHTKPYNDYLLLQLVGSTLTDVARKEIITEDILQGVIDSYAIEKIDWRSIKRIGLLGLDEIATKKGYNDYITLISSCNNGVISILGVVKGKKKAEIKAFLDTIPKKKRKTICAVCVDMCDAYIGAVKEVLGTNIPIVVDRFHVARLYRKAITKLRSSELSRLNRELSEDDYKSLAPAIRILIKKNECYDKEDKKELEILFQLSPAIKSAYRMARKFTHIYNTHHRKSTADKKIQSWIRDVEANDVNCLNTFIKTLRKYDDHITNYFINRNTSGWVEGLNNKVKVIKRRCYGLTNLKHFFQRIFLDLRGYELFLPQQRVSLT